tara:strand:+ start:72751 stop:74319 length:1569 start_codon:yes stop_codon:yes gene_type:complete
MILMNILWLVLTFAVSAFAIRWVGDWREFDTHSYFYALMVYFIYLIVAIIIGVVAVFVASVLSGLNFFAICTALLIAVLIIVFITPMIYQRFFECSYPRALLLSFMVPYISGVIISPLIINIGVTKLFLKLIKHEPGTFGRVSIATTIALIYSCLWMGLAFAINLAIFKSVGLIFVSLLLVGSTVITYLVFSKVLQTNTIKTISVMIVGLIAPTVIYSFLFFGSLMGIVQGLQSELTQGLAATETISTSSQKYDATYVLNEMADTTAQICKCSDTACLQTAAEAYKKQAQALLAMPAHPDEKRYTSAYSIKMQACIKYLNKNNKPMGGRPDAPPLSSPSATGTNGASSYQPIASPTQDKQTAIQIKLDILANLVKKACDCDTAKCGEDIQLKFTSDTANLRQLKLSDAQKAVIPNYEAKLTTCIKTLSTIKPVTASPAPTPKAKANTFSDYYPVTLDKLKVLLPVRGIITRKNGSLKQGIIRSATHGLIEIEVYVHGGHIEYNIPIDRVSKIEVWHEAKKSS